MLTIADDCFLGRNRFGDLDGGRGNISAIYLLGAGILASLCVSVDVHNVFTKLAKRAADWVGSQWAFAIAMSAIVIWGFTGPLFKFSDTWQLVINTSTTIITFLMVFLIQNTQNRDAKAIHLKLDELIRTNEKARNALIDLEDVTDDVLKKLETEFKQMHDDDDGRGAEVVLDAINDERNRRGA